ncbi:hypothetical protein BG842_02880 [Haladaptatus sp. W1]|uniref:HVO_A0114 family putative DNA-binding protein n=1 Tax=Haladaptatus sp. W1 TaxID=1897478 RepID=UPI0008498FE0|nr:hypothetical protein [Haladaptatus sp. W1]ODR80195.1 hypothetical protein BG842_02880 [Haladaptatus sp. W1]
MSATLHTRVEWTDNFHKDTLNAIEALECGDEPEGRHVLSLQEEGDLQRLFSDTNLELLRTQHKPSNMREAARLVDRGIKDVSRNLNELAELNVVELIQEGRSNRSVVNHDEFEIHVRLIA